MRRALIALALLAGCTPGLVPDVVRTQIQVDGAYTLGVQHGRQAMLRELRAQQEAQQQEA